MQARVMTVQIMPNKTDQMLNIYNSIISTTQKMKGFKGFLTLTNRTTNKAISISLWDTKADMEEGETSGYLKEKIAKIAAHNTFAGPPVTEHYDVSICTPPVLFNSITSDNSTPTG